MVIRPRQHLRKRGVMMVEFAVAMVILAIAVLPLVSAASAHVESLRRDYQKAVAMEIVDGEMEILAAGEWRNLPEGAHPYTVHSKAAANLPPGQFQFTRDGDHLRLEWRPATKQVKTIVREVVVK